MDTDLFSASLSSQEVAEIRLPEQFVVSIGSYIPRKGHLVLLEAFSSIAEAFPELHLVIESREAEHLQNLLATLREAGYSVLAKGNASVR